MTEHSGGSCQSSIVNVWAIMKLRRRGELFANAHTDRAQASDCFLKCTDYHSPNKSIRATYLRLLATVVTKRK